MPSYTKLAQAIFSIPKAIIFTILATVLLTTRIGFGQSMREWQSENGKTTFLKYMGKDPIDKKYQFLNLDGESKKYAVDIFSSADRNYIQTRELIAADREQFVKVMELLDESRTKAEVPTKPLIQLAKANPTSPYASLLAGVAMAATSNEIDKATTLFKEARSRIKQQQQYDVDRHRRTIVSVYINLAICYLKDRDADAAADEFARAHELVNEVPAVLAHNTKQLLEFSKPGAAFKLSSASNKKLNSAMARISPNKPLKTMQAGWYYSLDLQPPDGLETELTINGIEVPDPTLELIASGTGIVCAPGHVLTLRPIVLHQDRPATLVTIPIKEAAGRWKNIPAKSVLVTLPKQEMTGKVVGNSTTAGIAAPNFSTSNFIYRGISDGEQDSELVMLVAENLGIDPAHFAELANSSEQGSVIYGFQRGPSILTAGFRYETGKFVKWDDNRSTFRTSAKVFGGNSGGPWVTKAYEVAGIASAGSIEEKDSLGAFLSVEAVQNWLGKYVPTVTLSHVSTTSNNQEKELLKNAVVPVLVWGRSKDADDEMYKRFYDEGNQNDLLMLRDVRCMRCRGRGYLQCGVCGGRGSVQNGVESIPTGSVNSSGNPIFKQVKSFVDCTNCSVAGRVKCIECQDGIIKGGTGPVPK